jgi:hypothetical protein
LSVQGAAVWIVGLVVTVEGVPGAVSEEGGIGRTGPRDAVGSDIVRIIAYG